MELSHDLITQFEAIVKNKRYTECQKHGEKVQATATNQCFLCEREKVMELTKHLPIDRLQEISLIPPRYKDATIDNYEPTSDESCIFKEQVKAYAHDKNMILVGGKGRGKTHIACAILNQAIASGYSALYIEFFNAMHHYIHNYDTVFKQMIKCDILVLDEYGLQSTIAKKELLHVIIDSRYSQSTKNHF